MPNDAVLTPLVSVVIPTWNRAHVIQRAVNSVLTQTRGDFEVIVVDDGSEDDTPKLFQTPDPRIRYIRNPHLGLSATRNTGLENAKGELIAYLDSDNAWRPDYLEEMTACFERDPTLQSAYAAMEVFDNIHDNRLTIFRPYDRAELLYQNFIDLNIFMHRRELAQRLGGFDVRLTRFVDWELILRYTRESAPLALRKVLADYYLEPNLNHVSKVEDMRRNQRIVIERHWEEIVAMGLLDTLQRMLNTAQCGSLSQRMWKECFIESCGQLTEEGRMG